jgi:hypothetical protein
VNNLQAAHATIASQFENLFKQRQTSGGFVFFSEHSLSTDRLTKLRGELREALRNHSLCEFFWSAAYLPVVIVATEVGYEYEGNGTDFWPSLEHTLGYAFAIEDRSQLSHWFRTAAERYNGVRPGQSDWEQAFCHIAWPITHAVAAKDIRRPFADCLRRFNGSIEDDDASIASQLASISTSVGSRRFRTWLGSEQVVAGIVRELLDGPSLVDAGLLTKCFRDRLLTDLRNEPEIRQAVRTVQTRSKTQGTRNRRRREQSDEAETIELLYGSFFLKRDEDGRLGLFGELPEMPREIQKELRRHRRSWQPRPWGFAGASILPTNTLRSARGTFPVALGYIVKASDDRPFFTGLDELQVDLECGRWLRGVRLIGADRLAFRPVGDEEGDSSHLITSPTPHRGNVWVVVRTGVDWPDFEKHRIAAVEGGEVFCVDASNAVFRQWMGWPAARADGPKSLAEVTWLYPSPISTDSDGQLVFTTDDELGISVSGDRPVTLFLRSGRKEVARSEVAAVALAKIDEAGKYDLTVLKSDQTLDTLSFTIVDNVGDGFIEPDPEPPWRVVMSHVDTGETTLTRNDFFNRRLSIEVAGDRSIEDLPMTLSISPGECVAHLHLRAIPERIGPTHSVWDTLLDQLPQSVLQSACDLTVRVEVAGLVDNSWRLEADTQNLWWVEDGAAPRAFCDDGEYTVQGRTLVANRPVNQLPEGEPVVLVALNRDGYEFTFDARVCVVGDSRLQRQAERPNRLLREMDDVGSGVGLRQIASRYLQVASASSSSRVAEINRVGLKQQLRAWVIEILCGPNWTGQQRECEAIERSHPVAVWWETQLSHPVLLPEAENGLERQLPEQLPRDLQDEFARKLPLHWWDGVVSEINFAGELDDTYKRIIDEDVYVDADALTSSLRRASQRICGSHLADLVIPVTGGDELLAWSLLGLTVDELADEWLRWMRTHLKPGRGRQKWDKEELVDWLYFLLYPERLRRRDWQSVLEKLLNDRPVARAGAFLAWRMEQTSRIESFTIQEQTV